ncbi:MAG: hypothetical protein ACLGGX_08760 [Bdellovibrionia bacterium]
MTTKITKEDLKQDQIQTELQKGFKWTTKHSNSVIGAVIAFILLGGVYSGWQVWKTAQEEKNQEAYYLLEKNLLEKKRALAEARAQAKDQAPELAPEKLDADYGTTVADLKKFVTENPQKIGSRMGAILLVDIFREYKMLEEAKKLVQDLEPHLKKGELTSALLWSQWGNILADTNDCQGALQKWETVIAQKNLSYAHAEIKLRMGLCYENLQQADKAEALYAEVSKLEGEGVDFNATKEAEKYLKLLKAKKNLLSSGS